jgi:hypothetical protein
VGKTEIGQISALRDSAARSAFGDLKEKGAHSLNETGPQAETEKGPTGKGQEFRPVEPGLEGFIFRGERIVRRPLFVHHCLLRSGGAGDSSSEVRVS